MEGEVCFEGKLTFTFRPISECFFQFVHLTKIFWRATQQLPSQTEKEVPLVASHFNHFSFP